MAEIAWTIIPGEGKKTSGQNPIRTPAVRLLYAGKNITPDLAPYLLAVSYTDHLEGEADEIEVQIEDSPGRWRDTWYPGLGDELSLAIGYEGQRWLNCGSFELDQIEFNAPPDVVTLRALSAGVTKTSRTRRSRGYEDTTLRAIAEDVARRQQLTLVGTPPDLPLDRVTQYQEPDIVFLNRLAAEYGASFKITGSKLTFTALAERRAGAAVVILRLADVIAWRMTDKIKGVYKTAKVKYHDPKTRRLVEAEVTDVGPETAGQASSGDELRLAGRAKQPQQAKAQAQAALEKANLDKVTGAITLPGEPSLVGGITITLAEWGKLSGTYLIQSARHILDRSGGYTTELEVKKL